MSDTDTKEFIYSCSKCNAIVKEDTKICPKCGENIEETEEDIDDIEEIKVPFHFKILLFYGNFISFFGWLLVIAGAILIIISFSSNNISQNFYPIPSIAFIASGIMLSVIGFLSIANGQLISCFVTIEKNSRETNNILWVKLNAILKKIK